MRSFWFWLPILVVSVIVIICPMPLWMCFLLGVIAGILGRRFT